MKDELGRVGLVGRFKPLHNGAAVMLETLCEQSEHVIIGIGSSNKYNFRNPFTPKETKEMIHTFLEDRFTNYEVVEIPDFAHIPGNEDGQRWREYILESFRGVDHFISGNDFVQNLLKEDYSILHPAQVIPLHKHIPLRATRVRHEMAVHGDWEELVPMPVAQYITKNNLDNRFREEFGLQTIAYTANHDYNADESALQEKRHAQEI